MIDEITQAHDSIGCDETQATGESLASVYRELRKLAAQKLAREKPGQTLDATALVHEAYVRLVQGGKAAGARSGKPPWTNRPYFFAAAAEAMRRILVENARRKGREKHGGDLRREYPNLDALSMAVCPEEILTLHGALQQFAARDPLKAKLVELRFFGGLTLEQSAACLGISLSTADRAWRYARAWLYAAMTGDQSEKS